MSSGTLSAISSNDICMLSLFIAVSFLHNQACGFQPRCSDGRFLFPEVNVSLKAEGRQEVNHQRKKKDDKVKASLNRQESVRASCSYLASC